MSAPGELRQVRVLILRLGVPGKGCQVLTPGDARCRDAALALGRGFHPFQPSLSPCALLYMDRAGVGLEGLTLALTPALFRSRAVPTGGTSAALPEPRLLRREEGGQGGCHGLLGSTEQCRVVLV